MSLMRSIWIKVKRRYNTEPQHDGVVNRDVATETKPRNSLRTTIFSAITAAYGRLETPNKLSRTPGDSTIRVSDIALIPIYDVPRRIIRRCSRGHLQSCW